jgi:16S rRNA processing protein RimM
MLHFIVVGKILKPFRNDGNLLAAIDKDFKKSLQKTKAIFISVDGNQVPYFVENISFDGETAIIKFEEFGGPEDVKPHNNEELSLNEKDASNIKKKTISTFGMNDFIGFKIYDIESGIRGTITNVQEFPQQLMATVQVGSNEHFVPLIENFINEIDLIKKMIKMTLPQGILK